MPGRAYRLGRSLDLGVTYICRCVSLGLIGSFRTLLADCSVDPADPQTQSIGFSTVRDRFDCLRTVLAPEAALCVFCACLTDRIPTSVTLKASPQPNTLHRHILCQRVDGGVMWLKGGSRSLHDASQRFAWPWLQAELEMGDPLELALTRAEERWQQALAVRQGR